MDRDERDLEKRILAATNAALAAAGVAHAVEFSRIDTRLQWVRKLAPNGPWRFVYLTPTTQGPLADQVSLEFGQHRSGNPLENFAARRVGDPDRMLGYFKAWIIDLEGREKIGL